MKYYSSYLRHFCAIWIIISHKNECWPEEGFSLGTQCHNCMMMVTIESAWCTPIQSKQRAFNSTTRYWEKNAKYKDTWHENSFCWLKKNNLILMMKKLLATFFYCEGIIVFISLYLWDYLRLPDGWLTGKRHSQSLRKWLVGLTANVPVVHRWQSRWRRLNPRQFAGVPMGGFIKLAWSLGILNKH